MADIKSTFVNLTNNLAKSSGDLVKNTKLSLELANKEEQLKSLYVDIGKKVHEIYSFGGSLGAAFDGLYKEIIMCEASINDLRERIDIVKGVRTCSKCGKGVDRKSEFCPNCGNSMIDGLEVQVRKSELQPEIQPETMPEIQPLPETTAAKEVYKKCASCGANNPDNSRFCLGCGRVL